LKAVPVAVLPWLVPFLDLFRRAFWQSTRPCAKLRRYAAALTLGGLLVLSMAATKRENYLLPLMPPLMLLLALAVEDRLTGWLQATPRGRWYRIGDWTQATLLVLFALLPAAATVTYLHNVTVAAMAALVVGVAAAAAILCATRRRREDLMLWGAGGAAACFALSALLVAMPPLEPRKDFSPFLETMAAELPVGSSVSVVGADETIEAIVPFITGRSVSLLRAEDLRRPATTFSDEYLPAYLLVQVKRREPDPTPDVEDRYQRLRQVELGRGRTLSFWRRMR
ncbi:MAG: hypothetical protein KDD11_07265, partial [Acidobacteria bacterium]|nr:hypothetical protein [Acidobacteriota bacterium]